MGIGPLLDAFQQPALTSLVIRDDIQGNDIATETQPLGELLPFLGRFGTLQTLFLEMCWSTTHEYARGAARTLLCHSQSLESLIFDCRPVDKYDSVQDQTDRIIVDAIRQCKKLREVALWLGKANLVELGSVRTTYLA